MSSNPASKSSLRTPDSLVGAPLPVLDRILQHLVLVDRANVFRTCRALAVAGRAIDSKIRELKVCASDAKRLILHQGRDDMTARWLQRFQSLRRLDVGPHATSAFLTMLTERSAVAPQIEHIAMVGSEGITDADLAALAKLDTLQSLDITFCRNTTYAGTLPLRRALPRLLIRRQPEWLCGIFETPFLHDGQTEDHTYWPDGTFSFTRARESTGFVCQLRPHRENDKTHLGDKLQYSDFEPPRSWPRWARFAYRPGVSLLRVPDELIDGKRVRTVLVAQSLGAGGVAPSCAPLPEHRHAVPTGTSRYFRVRSDGTVATGEAKKAEPPRSQQHRYVMVSRMRVRPLPRDHPRMPPEEIVTKNRRFIESIARNEVDVERYEQVLNLAFARAQAAMVEDDDDGDNSGDDDQDIGGDDAKA